MDLFVAQVRDLWHVASDEGARWVEPLALADWVEDSKVRLCVAAR